MTPYLPIPGIGIPNLFQRLGILLLLFWGGLELRAQSMLVSSLRFDFVQHLIDNKAYDEAKWALSQMANRPNLAQDEKDSLQYLLGRMYYLNAQLDSSILAFEKTSKNSPFFEEARFFRAFGLLYSKRYTESNSLLPSLTPSDTCLNDFGRYMQAAQGLFTQDWPMYEENRQKLDHVVCSPFQIEKEKLPDYAQKFKHNKRKSAWKAGLFSAILPGSGKYYAGYRGQALASLFPCLVFGATTAESYFRAGPKSAAFIVSAGMFSLFYIGNIWGSALSVKTIYEQRNEEYRHRLLLDIQIPLHRIFGR